jgi:hypothetical protein
MDIILDIVALGATGIPFCFHRYGLPKIKVF